VKKEKKKRKRKKKDQNVKSVFSALKRRKEKEMTFVP